ncbi:hypothetical protein SUGI_0298150 [Cryptomeria japonica]|uniref:ethylene-responsive transcription factor ERF013-like n=1 Tax=Cryptomeria japonica TaxID=3369 RepID=UPI002408A634|nr:ethylene-responsive transcription factor ERF013-like [Cryptomeria japonica]GLJ17212.1 hypothetical protein SUGI_0298150 [Cryptomeria japonica]
MANGGEEMRYRGVRKRKWGKYVAEIRSGNRSRISLGSYSNACAAARAYDTALLCLRGPDATSFNFGDSKFSPSVLEVASAESNPSPQAVRTAAMAVGSTFDTIPPPPPHHNEEAGPSRGGSTSVEEAVPTETRDAPKDTSHQVEEEEEEEENDTKYLLQSPEHIPFEESVQMAPLQPDLQPYHQSEIFHDLDSWEAGMPKPPI